MLKNIKNGDFITVIIFGREEQIEILCTGDNRFDDNGNYKEEDFALNEEETACLDWFVENIDIADYKKEIAAYCNDRYEMIGDKQITEKDLEEEVFISAIAVNIGEVTQSLDGSLVYPEISFLGDCECDPEHGICIGFREKKFLGIRSQDWTL